MAITCIAIDDEPLALGMVESYCKKTPELDYLHGFTDAIEAISFIKHHKPQLLLLDIQMPDITGIQIAKNTDYDPQIIFTTAYSDYAVEGFELEATDYLLKPYGYDRFTQAIERVAKRLGVTEEKPSTLGTLFIKEGYKNVGIAIEAISHIEALDNYITIHTSQGKHTILQTMKSIENELPSAHFCRIHRSFIINKNMILSFSKTIVQIENKELPIGRSYTQGFINFMNP